MARAGFAGIAMDQSDELCIRLARAVAIHMKGNLFAGTNGNTVRVAEDLLLGHLLFLCQIFDVAKKDAVASLLQGRVALVTDIEWGLTAPA